MARSLNKVQVIGNLTRDPEMRYTPQGTAVCSFSVATNRQWKNDSGETQDEVEYHKIVAWTQLAEICNNLLKKGSKAFVEGRLKTREWETKEGQKRSTTEIVANEMILLDSKGGGAPSSSNSGIDVPDDFGAGEKDSKEKEPAPKKEAIKDKPKKDDIPF